MADRNILTWAIPLPRLFECFVEVTAPDPDAGIGPSLKRFHPEEFDEKEKLLQNILTFCFPCRTDSPGVQYFTFVLTDLDNKYRFGFCRYPAHAPSCICILSYAPWFEMFYTVLNNISDAELRGDNNIVVPLLDELHAYAVPEVGSSFSITANHLSTSKTFKYDVPDTTKLPTIPENRNLTQYFAAILPEVMVELFVSMLFERRILVTSKKLSLVTAIVHGSVSLLYPMQWQHIFVPVLPPKLLDFCCAPMPFLLGVHSSMMNTVRQMPLDDIVILDADKNEITSPFDDMNIFPQEVTSKLLSKLKKTERASEDYVASQFIRALVKVIGGYRDALKFKELDEGEGGKIIFDEDAFLTTRPSSIRPFLEHILQLQSFKQFVDGRLDLLNAGIEVGDIFEQEVQEHSGDNSKWKSQYQQWRGKMKKGGGALKKTVAIQYTYLKGKATDIELKSKVKAFYKGAKSGVKSSYKGAKHQFKQLKAKEGPPPLPSASVKRAESFPSSGLGNVKDSQFRHSMYSTMPSSRIQHGVKRSPNHGSIAIPSSRGNRHDQLVMKKSASSDCISSTLVEEEPETIEEEPRSQTPKHHLTLLERADTHSEPSITNLIDFDSVSLQETDELEKKQTMVFAQDNHSFTDDPFVIVDDSEIHSNMESTGVNRTSGSSWVTFDSDAPRDNSTTTAATKTEAGSPITEIGYEDLIRSHADQDNFLVVSPDNHVTEAGLNDLLKPRPVSLLTDTLSSVSPETRSLFNKTTPEIQAAAEPSPCLERKQRRPPPRPPPPRSGEKPESTQHPPSRNLTRRSAPKIPDRNVTDINCLQPTPANATASSATVLDPFADLLLETRKSLPLNQSNKDDANFAKSFAKDLKRVNIAVLYKECLPRPLGHTGVLKSVIEEKFKKATYGIVIISKAFFKLDHSNDDVEFLHDVVFMEHQILHPIWYQVSQAEVHRWNSKLGMGLALQCPPETTESMARKFQVKLAGD
eukprot:gene16102-17723_t